MSVSATIGRERRGHTAQSLPVRSFCTAFKAGPAGGRLRRPSSAGEPVWAAGEVVPGPVEVEVAVPA